MFPGLSKNGGAGRETSFYTHLPGISKGDEGFMKDFCDKSCERC